MSDELSKLRTSPVLANLTETELSQILEGANQREFVPGELLLEEGKAQDFMLLVANGKVEVWRGEIRLALRDGCHVLGEMALIDPGKRSASAVARSAGRLYELPRDFLWGMLHSGHPAAVKLVQNLTVLMCQRLEDINQLVQDEVVGDDKGNGIFGRMWNKLFGKGRK